MRPRTQILEVIARGTDREFLAHAANAFAHATEDFMYLDNNTTDTKQNRPSIRYSIQFIANILIKITFVLVFIEIIIVKALWV